MCLKPLGFTITHSLDETHTKLTRIICLVLLVRAVLQLIYHLSTYTTTFFIMFMGSDFCEISILEHMEQETFRITGFMEQALIIQIFPVGCQTTSLAQIQAL